MKIKQSIMNLEPYVSGFQPNLEDSEVLKLNANENAFSPSPKIKSLLENLDISRLCYYPSSKSDNLRMIIANLYGVSEKEVFCGNGSDEVISLIMRVFLDKGNKIVSAYPTYTVYKTYADMFEIQYQSVDVNENWEVDVNGLLKISSDAIFIANPNAPTGILMAKSEIEKILNNYDGLVVIDEAYMDFSTQDESAISLIKKYKNLIVLRTLSKSYSLCGIRVGMCLGNEELIEYLDKCRDSYNLNYLSQVIAIEGLKDQDYHKENIRMIVDNRDYLTKKLEKIGFDVLPSQTNFILCKPPGKVEAEFIVKKLYEYKIYIRYFNSPMLSNKLRITVGKVNEIDRLIKALKEILE